MFVHFFSNDIKSELFRVLYLRCNSRVHQPTGGHVQSKTSLCRCFLLQMSIQYQSNPENRFQWLLHPIIHIQTPHTLKEFSEDYERIICDMGHTIKENEHKRKHKRMCIHAKVSMANDIDVNCHKQFVINLNGVKCFPRNCASQLSIYLSFQSTHPKNNYNQ